MKAIIIFGPIINPRRQRVIMAKNFMKTKLFVLGAAIVLMASCQSTKSVSSTTSTARTLEPETPEMVADLEVANMKVTGEFKADFANEEAVNEQLLKDNAVYNALKTMK